MPQSQCSQGIQLRYKPVGGSSSAQDRGSCSAWISTPGGRNALSFKRNRCGSCSAWISRAIHRVFHCLRGRRGSSSAHLAGSLSARRGSQRWQRTATRAGPFSPCVQRGSSSGGSSSARQKRSRWICCGNTWGREGSSTTPTSRTSTQASGYTTSTSFNALRNAFLKSRTACAVSVP